MRGGWNNKEWKTRVGKEKQQCDERSHDELLSTEGKEKSLRERVQRSHFLVGSGAGAPCARTLSSSWRGPLIKRNNSFAYSHPDSYWHFVRVLLVSFSNVPSTGDLQAAGGRVTVDQNTWRSRSRVAGWKWHQFLCPKEKFGTVLWALFARFKFNLVELTVNWTH